jgi:HSP20 family protein
VIVVLFNHDPFDAFRALDRLTGQYGAPGTGMPMDVYRTGDHFVVDLDVPGVEPGSIDVSVDGNIISVSAERTAPTEVGEWLVAERPRGRYARQLTLGRDLDAENLRASYVDGVLTLTIPVAKAAKPRRIAIEHTGRQASIEQGGQGEQTEPVTG